MTNHLNRIKNIALEMRRETSRNDTRWQGLQEICDLTDELMIYFVDDGR